MKVLVPSDCYQDAEWGLWLHIIPQKSQGSLRGEVPLLGDQNSHMQSAELEKASGWARLQIRENL